MRIIDEKAKPKPFVVWACIYKFVRDKDKEFFEIYFKKI